MSQQDSIGNLNLSPLGEIVADSVNTTVFFDSISLAENIIQGDSVYSDSIVIETPSSNDPIASVFESHTLKPTDKEPLVHHNNNIDWISFHFILLLGLIAWARINYPKRLIQITKSFIAPRFLHQMAREGNIFRERVAIPLFIIYLISFSLLLFLLARNLTDFHVESFTDFRLFSIILLFVLISWIFKNIFVHFIGYTFKNELILSDFILTNFVFNLVSGIFFFPLLAISVYTSSKEILIGASFLWVLIFVFKIIRELFTGLSYKKFSLFNRFLYLCTLEIIPILILIKLAMSNLKIV